MKAVERFVSTEQGPPSWTGCAGGCGLVPAESRSLFASDAKRPPRAIRLIASLVLVAAMALVALVPAGVAAPLELRSGTPIVVRSDATDVERFAASELVHYLGAISGASYAMSASDSVPSGPVVLVGAAWAREFREQIGPERLGEDGIRLKRAGDRVLVAGAGTRGTLNAAYAFLEILGCRWFAPNFEFYGDAGGEHVPRVATPAVDALDVVQRPSFSRRKKYVEEGETHDVPTLLKMIDWMAKVRLNVLNCPINYEGRGHTKWDNFREALIPELRKRGILIEVGGHGYQNFLPADRYFAAHPEWFGMIKGQRTDNPHVVFSTSNPEAVSTFVANIRAYLRAHPEIDIFDCWPPDGAKWSEAPEDVALGSPTERQLLLLNRVVSELKGEFPRLQVQFLAYSSYVEPPKVQRPAPGVVMEFCPINRGFQAPLFDGALPQNLEYFQQLKGWLSGVMDPGAVTLYSYVTKYRWRSLPILVPHLIAAEADRFSGMGLGGISSYSEPGAWAALELDHYFLSRWSWDSRLDVEQELRDYTGNRYGAAAEAVRGYFALVERIVPHAVAVVGSNLNEKSQRRHVADFARAAQLLEQAAGEVAGDRKASLLVSLLEGSRRYTLNEMQLRLEFLEGSAGWKRGQLERIEHLLAERRKIVEENRSRGLLVVDARTW